LDQGPQTLPTAARYDQIEQTVSVHVLHGHRLRRVGAADLDWGLNHYLLSVIEEPDTTVRLVTAPRRGHVQFSIAVQVRHGEAVGRASNSPAKPARAAELVRDRILWEHGEVSPARRPAQEHQVRKAVASDVANGDLI